VHPLSSRSPPDRTPDGGHGRGILRADPGDGHAGAAHAPVFMAIDPGGSRVTELAERAGMSKQAVGELIRHLADRGYLTVIRDPVDRRAKKVELTERGWAALDLGEGVIADFDAWLEAAIGDDQVTRLRSVLTRILTSDLQARID
jgi:DNA-binding MarR family transcriptional regulator